MHSSAAVYLDSKRIGECFIFFLILSALQLQRRDGRQGQESGTGVRGATRLMSRRKFKRPRPLWTGSARPVAVM